MDALPEVRHQVTERPQLPALIEPVEALRDAVVRGRDLVGVDGIQLLAGNFWIPEDQGPPSDQLLAAGQPRYRWCGLFRGRGGARFVTRRLNGVHEARDDSILSSRSSTASAAAVVVRVPPRSLVARRPR